MLRSDLIEQLVKIITAIEHPHPLRVGIDGIDAAGKTSLADELVHPLERNGRAVIRASLDDFHNPQEVRYRRGELSPEGYFYDSFDYINLKRLLLDPLSRGGSLHYKSTAFDLLNDRALQSDIKVAECDAVLLFDGVFLLRKELENCWDLRIFLQISFDECLRRATNRDVNALGSKAEIHERYNKRYLPGQSLYLETCRPEDNADLIIDNNYPAHPILRNLRKYIGDN